MNSSEREELVLRVVEAAAVLAQYSRTSLVGRGRVCEVDPHLMAALREALGNLVFYEAEHKQVAQGG